MLNRFTIMLIEDDAIEVMKLKRVLLKLSLEYTVIEKSNGQDALDYLVKKENLPDIILLDLNMPILNGFEFLQLMKKEETIKYIPIVVLSSSDNQNDVLEAYTHGVSGFIKKPLKFEDYIEHVKTLLSYWKINQLVSK